MSRPMTTRCLKLGLLCVWLVSLVQPRCSFLCPGWRNRLGKVHRVRCQALSSRDLLDPQVAASYLKLGLELGADLDKVKRSFRRLAREYHPDVAADDGEEFAQIKEAYDYLTEAWDRPPDDDNDFRPRGFNAFARNMATGQGHHKMSDGRLFELWLDLRGDSQRIDNARQEVLSLFWGVRAIVDSLGASLLKEGSVGGIVADSATPPSLLRAWDYGWMPMVQADSTSSELRSPKTEESYGWIWPVKKGKLFSSWKGNERFQAEPDDLVIFAADAFEAEDAINRYKFLMKALLLPPDPAAWTVAAAARVKAVDAVETLRRNREYDDKKKQR